MGERAARARCQRGGAAGAAGGELRHADDPAAARAARAAGLAGRRERGAGRGGGGGGFAAPAAAAARAEGAEPGGGAAAGRGPRGRRCRSRYFRGLRTVERQAGPPGTPRPAPGLCHTRCLIPARRARRCGASDAQPAGPTRRCEPAQATAAWQRECWRAATRPLPPRRACFGTRAGRGSGSTYRGGLRSRRRWRSRRRLTRRE